MTTTHPAPTTLEISLRSLLSAGTPAALAELHRICAGLRLSEMRALSAELVAAIAVAGETVSWKERPCDYCGRIRKGRVYRVARSYGIDVAFLATDEGPEVVQVARLQVAS